jgi:cytochrome c oxidase cbb3-type subunit 3
MKDTPEPDRLPPVTIHAVFDGIEEQDNHLPNWWLGILFGSIVFGFGYWFVYETTRSAPGPLATLQFETAELARKRAATAPVSNETLLVLSHDQATVDDGVRIFKQICAPCHGPEATGVVGPNLTDRYWLHGAKPLDIHKSITEGFPQKGMPAWAPLLGPTRVRTLAAFVLSLKGKNLPGKAPQGVPVD